jgi:hypothetical protein
VTADENRWPASAQRLKRSQSNITGLERGRTQVTVRTLKRIRLRDKPIDSSALRVSMNCERADIRAGPSVVASSIQEESVLRSDFSNASALSIFLRIS